MSTRKPRYTDADGTRKAPFQYSEQYQQWHAAVLRNDRPAIQRCAQVHNARFCLFIRTEEEGQ